MEVIWNQVVVNSLTQVLGWLNSFSGSYGAAIMLLGLAFYTVQLPLNVWLTKWSRQAADIQPQVQRLQAKYANDGTRMAQELRRLYSNSGINMQTGCLLPFLTTALGLIMWIGLYTVIRSTPGTQQNFLWIPNLALPNGLPTPEPALNYLIMPIVLIVIQFIRYRTLAARNNNAFDLQAATWVNVIIMIIIGALAVVMPAGLALFWMVSLLLDLVYQLAAVGERARLFVSIALGLVTTFGLNFLLANPIVALVGGWYIFEIVYPVVLTLINQPHKLAVFILYLLPRLSLTPIAVILAWEVVHDPTVVSLVAYVALIACEFMFALILRGIAPVIYMEARIACQTTLGRTQRVQTLQQELRNKNISTLRKEVEKGQVLLPKSHAEARLHFAAVVTALQNAHGRNAEENRLLAEAYYGLGDIEDAAGNASSAITDFTHARELNQAKAAARLAVLLARKGDLTTAAVNAYLDYLQSRRGSAIDQNDRLVLGVLEPYCRIDEQTADADAIVRRNESVLGVYPDVEWVHYYLGVGYLRQSIARKAVAQLELAWHLVPDRPETYFYLGQAYLALANRPFAESAFRKTLELNPRQPVAAYQYGNLLLEPLLSGKMSIQATPGQDLLKDALEWLNKAVSLDGTRPEYFYMLGRAYLLQTTYRSALDAFEQVTRLKTAHQPAEFYYYQAMAYAGLHDRSMAQSSLEKALENQVHFGPAHLLLADLYFEENNYQAAIAHYVETLANPVAAGDNLRNEDIHRRLGRCYFETGDYTSAITELTPVMQGNREATYYLGRSCSKLRQFEQAIKFYQQLAQTDGDAQYYLGCAFANVDRYERAMVVLQQCLTLAPDRWQAHLQMGHILFNQEQYTAARDQYAQVLRTQPANVDAMYALGLIEYRTGNLPEARAQFEHVLKLETLHAPTQQALALVHEKQGEMDLAIAGYEQAGNYTQLARIYCERGKYALAYQSLQKAQQAGDTSDASTVLLGYALAMDGQYVKALRAWSSIADNRPENLHLSGNISELHFVMGHQYALSGEYTKAAQAWKKFLDLCPGDTEVANGLADMYFRQADGFLRKGAGNGKKAHQLLQHAIDLVGATDAIEVGLALCDMDTQNYKDAVNRWGELLNRQPGQLGYAYHLGISLLMQNELAGARDQLNRVIAESSDASHLRKARWALAVLCMREGRWEEAANLFASTINQPTL